MSQRINLAIHRKFSLLAGFRYPMPENYNSKSSCFRFFWSLYVCVPYAFMLVELVSQAVQITLSISNIETITTCTLSTVYIVQFLLKLIVFSRNRETFDRIFDEMSAISRDLMQNPFGDDTFLKFFDEYYKTALKIGVVKGSMQMICNQCLIILFCVLSWIGRRPKMTPAYSWTPYDSSKEPGYTFTCLFEMIAYGSVTARTGVFDLLFWVMVIIPTAQLNYLKHLMGIMLKDADDDDDDDDDVKGIERTDIVHSESTASDEVMFVQLEWWIKMHQRVLRMVCDFESLASPFLAVNFVASMIDLFMSGFVAISSSNWDVSQRILINAIIIADAFQLYVVSLAGDWLRESSQNVADYGFSALIFTINKEIRLKYLFILTRSRRLIKLRFGGIYRLSSQTFLTLIQLTLTYFVTVLQIRNSQIKSESTVSV